REAIRTSILMSDTTFDVIGLCLDVIEESDALDEGVSLMLKQLVGALTSVAGDPNQDYGDGYGGDYSDLLYTNWSASDLQLNSVKYKGKKKEPEQGTYPAVEHNTSILKDPSHFIPEPIVVMVHLNGKPICALLDSSLLGDFVSTTIVTQLGLSKTDLTTPLNVQMATQGSRSKINYNVSTKLRYQGINCERKFDVMNLSGYDLILGTPWFYQHRTMVGSNPTQVIIGSEEPLEMKGAGVFKLASQTMGLYEDRISEIQEGLMEYTRPICQKAAESPLPLLCDIDHTIDLIDE
ncbi:hypothetical protein DXG01_005614, partial [Tephrocybe rancida]